MISNNFYYVTGDSTISLKNCYYLNSIINEKVEINDDSISFARNDNQVIENLNKYVEEHKNDYGVELYKWKLDSNGLPTFKTND